MASKRTIADFIKPAAVLAGFPGHDYTLSGLLQSRLQPDAARPCILFNDKTWTWSEFVDAVGKTAGMLAARGIRHGDRVAVMAGNSDAHVRMLFALARLGAIMVPVNPDYGGGLFRRHPRCGACRHCGDDASAVVHACAWRGCLGALA